MKKVTEEQLLEMLDALQQMTQSVSNNFSSKSLIDIFYYLLQTHIGAEKMTLFLLGDAVPVIKTKSCNFAEQIPPMELLERETIGTLDAELYQGFDLVVPVLHKTKTLGLVLIGRREPSQYLGSPELSFLQTLCNIIVYAHENKSLFRDKVNQEKVKQELKMAAAIQEKLIPKELPALPPFSFSGFYKPFTEVGGDYFDVVKMADSRYLVIVADVSGKGLPAALLMSNIQAATRTLIRYETDLRKIVDALNHLVWDHAQGDHFVVAFMGALNLTTRSLEYVNAGQVAPFFVENGNMSRLKAQVHPLGVLSPMKPYSMHELIFKEKSALFLFTDGLSDSVSLEVDHFDLRLATFSEEGERAPAWESKFLDHLGLGPHRDDLSLLTVAFFP